MAAIPAGVIIMWPGNHSAIPAGWARTTAMDGYFPKGTASSTNPNNTGGSANHTHTADTHTHAGPNHSHNYSVGATNATANGVYLAGSPNPYMLHKDHTHNGTTPNVSSGTSGATASSWDTISPAVPFYDMIKIQSDGTPTGFPDDSVVLYNGSSAPSGWGQHSGSVGKFPSTPGTGANGGSSGGGSHAHSAGGSHTHTAPGTHDHDDSNTGPEVEPAQTSRYSGVQCYWRIADNHTHGITFGAAAIASAGAATSPDSAAASYEPTYRNYMGVENTSGSNNWLEGAICMWLGTLANIPGGWTLDTDMNDRYIRFAASGGGDNDGTGGNAGHSHSAPSGHTHTAAGHSHSTTDTTGIQWDQNLYINIWQSPKNTLMHHAHPATNTANNTSSYASTAQDINTDSDSQPAHRTVAFIIAPAEPVDLSVIQFGTNF